MVAVEEPRAGCGHVAKLTQQCGRCLRWCCPSCYSPWMALACNGCRAEAAARTPRPATTDQMDPPPKVEVGVAADCDGRRAGAGPSRPRSWSRPSRHRVGPEVLLLARRIADLERRLEELGSGF